MVQCEEDASYSSSLPKFYLGHSLGSKLLGIQLAASGVRDAAGVGFMSYNNFGFKDTISMVKDFADGMNNDNGSGSGGVGDAFGGMGGMGGMGQGAMFDQILEFAGEAVGMMGLEFNPNPETMDRIVEMKYDEELQKKTRLFIFDDDDLDSSDSFIDACSRSGSSGTVGGPSISRLKGKHLTPVFVKFGLDDLEISEDVKPFVDEAAGGFQSASFGDEEAMDGAVDEVCSWIMGKEPRQRSLITGSTSSSGSSDEHS